MHALRRACRAAEAAAWVALGGDGEELRRLRRGLRRLRRLAGDIRDCDVARRLVSERNEFDPHVHEAIGTLRRERERSLVDFVERRRRGGVASAAHAALRAAEQAPDHAERVCAELERRFRELCRGVADGPEALHRARIAGKRALLARAATGGRPGPGAALVARLGRAHDRTATSALLARLGFPWLELARTRGLRRRLRSTNERSSHGALGRKVRG